MIDDRTLADFATVNEHVSAEPLPEHGMAAWYCTFCERHCAPDDECACCWDKGTTLYAV